MEVPTYDLYVSFAKWCTSIRFTLNPLKEITEERLLPFDPNHVCVTGIDIIIIIAIITIIICPYVRLCHGLISLLPILLTPSHLVFLILIRTL